MYVWEQTISSSTATAYSNSKDDDGTDENKDILLSSSSRKGRVLYKSIQNNQGDSIGWEKVITTPSSSSSNNMVTSLLSGLCSYIKGSKSDTLSLLGTTALVAPICNKLGISNILGFLAAGMALGPNGIKGGLINDIHTTEMLADLGIVFFLFEMVRCV